MKIFLSFIVFLGSIATAHAASNSHNLYLDDTELAPFVPLIMEETTKAFAHQSDARTQRDTREYGFSFFNMMNKDFSYSPPPAFLQKLGALICLKLGHKPKEFTNIILSLYQKGFHLEPHIDVHAGHPDAIKNGFYFDEEVYGIIIEADESGHLYFIHYEGDERRPPADLPAVLHLKEKAGTIFCIQSPYRRAPFFHGVSNVSKQRISITFRTVVHA